MQDYTILKADQYKRTKFKVGELVVYKTYEEYTARVLGAYLRVYPVGETSARGRAYETMYRLCIGGSVYLSAGEENIIPLHD